MLSRVFTIICAVGVQADVISEWLKSQGIDPTQPPSVKPSTPSIHAGKCDFASINITTECPMNDGPEGLGIDWEIYAEELYKARSLIFSGDIKGAKMQTWQLLSIITKNFYMAFECPLATMSTYWTLTNILAHEGNMRRALSMLMMGFIFVRDKGFNECTPWPVQGWDVLMAGKNLLHEVAKMDEASVLTETPKQIRYEKQRMAVVTICSYAPDETVRVISKENHEMYTQLHGYDLHFFTSPDEILPHAQSRMNVQDGVHKPFFWKVNAVKNVFDGIGVNGTVVTPPDWVLWADCDALFMDPERTLDSIVHMYTGNSTLPITYKQRTNPETYQVYEQYMQGNPSPASLILALDSTGINNGVWLMKNDDWSHNFLEEWWHSDILQGAGKNHNCSDQSTMQHQLLYNGSMAFDEDWDSVEGWLWGGQVRIARQEHLQSFHQATAQSVQSREWVDGDFLRHHPGCHYYREPCKWLYKEAQEIFMDKVSRLLQGAQQ